MKILLTLDYELFLGKTTGSVQKCLIEPMERLQEETKRWSPKFTLFVDAVYLYRLKMYGNTYPELQKDFELITEHLKRLQAQGHDIQLHIHPHWWFSHYDGKRWILDNEHYKLSDLTEKDAQEVFLTSKECLETILGKKVIAFRAGGFSAQPTERMAQLFAENNMIIDSSVYPGNNYDSPHQKYDYRNCPDKPWYRFEKDICKEEKEGKLIEIPLTVYRLSPLFYWMLSIIKLQKLQKHRHLGDGTSVRTTHNSIWERLTHKTAGFATIDGYKISYLYKAYRKALAESRTLFCVIGHPKLTTPYSAKQLGQFCAKVAGEAEFITIAQCHE
jgi:hypothetical protein